MRLFVAIRPTQEVLAHLETALAAVRGSGAGGTGPWRWVPEPDRHITLAFLGEVPGGYLDELATGLGRAVRHAAPFGLALRGAGVVDRRVLWVGCSGDTAALAELMVAVAAAAAGIVPPGHGDARVRSRAHLTVARLRDPARVRDSATRSGHRRAAGPPPADVVRALSVYHGPTWTVEHAVLVESRLGAGPGGGPLYTDLATLPLWQDDGHGAAPRTGE